jgi:peptidoglycan/LPS O-acetylase OafA/YrhL
MIQPTKLSLVSDEKNISNDGAYRPVLILSILIVFLGLSLIKYDLFDHFGGVTYRTVLWYNTVRFLLFGAFLYTFLFSFSHSHQHDQKSKTIDPYAVLRKEYDPLLGLRAAAFLTVFLGHWFMVVFPPFDASQPEGSILARSFLSASPWGGVWVFFTLSGYLMGKGFITGRYHPDLSGISSFYRNRVLRIFPLYFLSIFIITLLQKPERFQFSSATQLDSLLSELLFDAQGNGAIGALWSVSTEVQFYLVIPFIHIIASRYMRSLTRVLVIMLGVITIVAAVKIYSMIGWPTYWHRHVYYPVLSNLDTFLVGYASSIIVNILREKSIYLKAGMKLAILLGTIYYILLSYASYITMVQEFTVYRLLYLAIFPGITAIVTSVIIILFEISVRANPGNAFVSRKAWLLQSILGLLTYSLYVWHEPVILSIRKVFNSSLTITDSILYLPIGLTLTVVVSNIFYRFIEIHFDALRSTKSHLPSPLRDTERRRPTKARIIAKEAESVETGG